MADSFQISGEEGVPAFDLRIFYAGIIGRNLVEINETMKKNQFSKWFELLQVTYPLVFSRVDSDREGYRKKYRELEKKVIDLAREYRKVYSGDKNNEKEVGELKEALIKLTHFVFRLAHLTGQFGTIKKVKGLY